MLRLTRSHQRSLLLIALLVILLYVVIPQVGAFQSSWQALGNAAPAWILLAVGLTSLTYLAGAATYCFLAVQPLSYARTVLVELAATFINRLLPAGIGAVGVNYAYLRRQRHGAVQAAAVVAVNNILGLMGHGLLLAVTLLFFRGHALSAVDWQSHTVGWAIALIVAVAAVCAVAGLLFYKKWLLHAVRAVRTQLSGYRHRPECLVLALISSMALTLCNVLCLSACVTAVGAHVALAATLVIFSFGVGAGTVTPTPGGLGGFEAGLTAGLVAYHIPSSTALAAALLYRLVSYWLPLAAGGPALLANQRLGLFSLDRRSS